MIERGTCRNLQFVAFILFVFIMGAIANDNAHAQGRKRIQDIASFIDRIRESVFIVGIVDPTTEVFQGIGTAWTLDRNHLATNAHVVEALRKLNLRKPGSRIVAKHDVFDRQEIVLGALSIHPAYYRWNGRLRNMMNRVIEGVEKYKPVAVSDIGLLEVMAGDPGKPLPVLTAKHSPPVLLNELFYVGYPTEDISGFATLRAVPVRVTAITDFFFRPVTWRDGELLHLSGPTTGGASGSPVFTDEGVVVGILSAADHIGVQSGREDGEKSQQRLPVGFMYAQRVDLAVELRDGSAPQRQDDRDPVWRQIVREQFMQAQDIIDLILWIQAEKIGIPKRDWEAVTQQTWTFTPDAPSLSRKSLNLRMDDGYVYLFVAVSEDGTNIDGRLLHDGELLKRDRAKDHYPLIVYENDVVRRDALLEIYAAQDLLAGRTKVVVCVYRHPLHMSSSRLDNQREIPSGEEEDIRRRFMGEEIYQEDISTARNGEYIHRIPLRVDREFTYTVQAKSREERDIDLVVRQGDRILVTDRDDDHYPMARFSRVSGEVEIELIVPSTSRVGEYIGISVRRQSNEAASRLLEGLELLQSLANAEVIRHERYEVPRNGRMSHLLSIQVESGYTYYMRAKSLEERDIDMIVRQHDRVIASDEANDHYPLIQITDRTGTVECEILIPSDSRRGEVIEIVVLRTEE